MVGVSPISRHLFLTIFPTPTILRPTAWVRRGQAHGPWLPAAPLPDACKAHGGPFLPTPPPTERRGGGGGGGWECLGDQGNCGMRRIGVNSIASARITPQPGGLRNTQFIVTNDSILYWETPALLSHPPPGCYGSFAWARPAGGSASAAGRALGPRWWEPRMTRRPQPRGGGGGGVGKGRKGGGKRREEVKFAAHPNFLG